MTDSRGIRRVPMARRTFDVFEELASWAVTVLALVALCLGRLDLVLLCLLVSQAWGPWSARSTSPCRAGSPGPSQ